MRRLMLRSTVASSIAITAVTFAATPGEVQVNTDQVTTDRVTADRVTTAQANGRTPAMAGVNDCIAEAIATNAVDDDGVVIVFSCNAAKARRLYNFLGKKIDAEVVQDHNGKSENLAFGNSACYHRVEDQSGKPADEFRCELVIAIGDALGE